MNNSYSKKPPLQGEIWLIKYDQIKENRKPFRPCLVISNDLQNKYDEEVIILPITTKRRNSEKELFFEIPLVANEENGLDKNSWVLTNRVHSADKNLRLIDFLGKVDNSTWNKVLISLWKTFTLKIDDELQV